MILQKLAERIIQYADGFEIIDYCSCLRATYVVVKDKRGNKFIGVSHISYENLHNQGAIIKPEINKLQKLVNDINVINRSFGLALINAISQKYIEPKKEYPEIKEPICIIGNMQPLVKEFYGRKFYVFEKSTELRGNAMSDSEEELLVPECKTLFITGVTLLNFTLERILEISNGTNILIGPSAGFIPELAKDLGINYVQSMKFYDIEKIREFLRLGNFISLKINEDLGINYSIQVK
ncbi:Rossmann-like domain-containing protein [Acidianus ambivalens]|uniref:Heavy-metal chelation domain-containing protein n=1 Tax=Acidianus ambivalens TaxID=2283 RepID=A0A650CVN1_ACIAM|nr:DUF364 domain-containing protein [Acidianus ambivalens]MQL56541.1 hypothetical protein [Acidianus ambivalens]QGR21934.1 hypothetical protein D1866_07900 [Acidianus ambivalens]